MSGREDPLGDPVRNLPDRVWRLPRRTAAGPARTAGGQTGPVPAARPVAAGAVAAGAVANRTVAAPVREQVTAAAGRAPADVAD
jgi:hypothetical protein